MRVKKNPAEEALAAWVGAVGTRQVPLEVQTSQAEKRKLGRRGQHLQLR